MVDLDNLSSKTIFKYIMIIFISILIFRSYDIKLNMILGLFIGYLIVAHNYNNNSKDLEYKQKQHETKIKHITPDLDKQSQKKDIVDFLFSIQDLYHYNPQTYEEMIDNINSFFHLYRQYEIVDHNLAHIYKMAEDKKSNAMNALHAVIYNLPSDKHITDKLNKAILRLENILNMYLIEIKEKHRRIIKKNGHNVDTTLIYIGPKAHNQYLNTHTHTYDVF